MDEEGPTDVLSFPMDELRPGTDDEEPEPGLLGDVVLCPAVAAQQAAAAGHSTDEELDLLTTHGILHLLGYDHAEPDEEREMFGLQTRAAARLGRGAAGERADDRATCSSSPACWSCSRGLFAGAEAALSRVSRVAAEELAARGPPRRAPAAAGARGPGPLPQPAHPAAGRRPSWSPPSWSPSRRSTSSTTTWQAVLVASASMVVVSYIAIGVSPRTLGRQHPAPIALAGGPVRAPAGPGARPAAAAADPGRQRAHARQGLQRGTVRVRGRAARAGRPRRGEPAHRGPRAGDDPLGLRARRHDRPRGDGAAHRRRLHRARQDAAPGACRSRCAAASAASR